MPGSARVVRAGRLYIPCSCDQHDDATGDPDHRRGRRATAGSHRGAGAVDASSRTTCRPNDDAFRNVAECLRRRQPAVVRSRLRRRSRVGRADRAAAAGRRRHADRRGRGHRGRRPSTRDLMKGDPLRGVHAFYSASAREWWAPLRPDRRVFRRNALVGVLDKPSEFAGRAVHEWTAQVFRDDDGHAAVGPVPADDPHRAREGAREEEVRRHRARAVHRRADRRASTRSTPRAAPRGAEPRWWEDVDEGDEVGPMVKGPLHGHRHGVLARRAWAWASTACKPLRLGVAQPPAHPALLPPRRPERPRRACSACTGIPSSRAAPGNPTTFDYGRMRETWLIHLCTDWMGDDAWLWKLDCEFRRFNYVGDTQWLRGTVVAQVPRRRRPARGRPRARGDEPAGRGHHARARHDPAAEPRARPGAAARPARRRDRPRRARSTAIADGVRAPMSDADERYDPSTVSTSS